MLRIAHIFRAGLVLCSSFLCASGMVLAQEQEGDVPLGDLARAVRKSKPVLEEKKVIDNDNLGPMMEKAESARLNKQPVFSIDTTGRTFHMTSPDGACSLSFDATVSDAKANNAKAGDLNSGIYIASDLPQDELLKLQGPAIIQDGQLQVSVHNGSAWELKEIVVGITVLESPGGPGLHPAKLADSGDAAGKLPDMTVLYHLKGSGAPDSLATFSASLGASFAVSRDWHWAIVAARGIPPASPRVAPGNPPAVSSPTPK